MRERYEDKLSQLQNELLDMGMLCEQAIMKTYQLLISGESRETLIKEIKQLEKEADGKEQIIEGICIQLLLRQQPVAGDGDDQQEYRGICQQRSESGVGSDRVR